MSNSPRSQAGAIVAGLFLIGLGVVFLLGQFVRIDIFGFLWPFIIIAIGVLFFVGMLTGGRPAAGLAIPGSIIMMIGLLLLIQNTFGLWDTWAYAWALIIVAVGIGVFIMGLMNGEARTRRAGMNLAGLGVVLFLVFGVFFEALAFGRIRGALWPLALIALGVYLLIRRSGLFASRSSSLSDSMPASPPEATPPPPPSGESSTKDGV